MKRRIIITLLGFLLINGQAFSDNDVRAGTGIHTGISAGIDANSNAKTACVSCHQSEQAQWQKSDHAKAMALASPATVKANFNRQEVNHFGQKAYFYRENKHYKVDISNGEISNTYTIKYTFGHYPLQQYLVETKPGRVQVFPFSWDARARAEGGQRWYHNYSHEEITPDDRLHWRQPLQNWNGMCADCHSDGLVRNYDAKNDSFNSQWQGINVGCLSCHGKMKEHVEQQPRNKPLPKGATQVSKSVGHWQRNASQKTANWQGIKRDNSFMDKCFVCHALRAPLTDGIDSTKTFLDQFTPTLLNTAMYHPDGQIKEEVYVYGSFLQSKMYAAGVNCLDCHDKHTMKLKIAGNGLCLQCHSNDVYNAPTHHQHLEDSSGSQCVNCHMPNNRYMGVDDRRDHSFKIPRSDISTAYGSPNACVKCHSDKDNQWASNALKNWFGKPSALSETRLSYYRLQSGKQISLLEHLAIVADEQLDVISRATALQLLSTSRQQVTVEQLTPYVKHQEELIRLAVANAASLLVSKQRVELLKPLLSDNLKAIRVAAAKSLLDAQLASQDMTIFKQAFIELQQVNELNSWRGEGRLNKAMTSFHLGEFQQAEQEFLATIAIEPYFDVGYRNLANFYRMIQKPEQEQIA
jgi:predicted CXXCH cytochrome family protein